jgi:hypothetical protein
LDIAAEIKDRIVAAADQLYMQSGEFPTVAAVRSKANVDMNAASTVMREWRRARSALSAPPAVDVPDKIRTVHGAALASLWAEAQAIANESLQAMQAAWDADRAEAEAIRKEIAAAFEGVRGELEAAQAQAAKHLDEIASLRTDVSKATERASTAEARTVEIDRRANDLAAQLATIQSQTRSELDQARKDASLAREEAARLQGKVEAMSDQHAELLRVLGASGGPSKGKGG